MNQYYSDAYPGYVDCICPQSMPSHNQHYAYMRVDEPIYLQANDSTEPIAFPSYLKQVTISLREFPFEITKENPFPAQLDTVNLQVLHSLVKTLPGAARTIAGTPATIIQNVYQVIPYDEVPSGRKSSITILVNQQVQNAVALLLKDLQIERLLAILNVLDSRLEIPSLKNAVGYVITKKIYPEIFNIVKQKFSVGMNVNDKYNIPPKLIFEALDAAKSTRELNDRLKKIVAKYIYLQSLNVREKTIADYIGMNGISGVTADGELILSREEITGLSGMELISNNEALYANLGSNTILGDSLDPNFPRRPFRGLGNLQWLDLSDNHLTTLPEGVFSGLGDLRRGLNLSRNHLTTLSEGVFNGLGNLGGDLYLSSNHLTTLPEGVFNDLGNLRDLHLNNNHLTTLPEGVFSGLGKLRLLSLHDNHLTTLPEGVFRGLGNLQWIGLANNHLTTLPEGVFSGLGNLQWLNLNNNHLTTLPEGVFNGLGNLGNLYLNNNHLTTLPKRVFRGLGNLKWLELYNNHLTTLPERVFRGLGNLKWLELSDNHLTTLPEGVFRGLENLQYLLLNRNHLTTLPKRVFRSLGQLTRLYIENNRLSGTEADFRKTHSIPNHVKDLRFSPQQPPLSASMRYSPRYSNPCACFEKPVSPYCLFHSQREDHHLSPNPSHGNSYQYPPYQHHC